MKCGTAAKLLATRSFLQFQASLRVFFGSEEAENVRRRPIWLPRICKQMQAKPRPRRRVKSAMRNQDSAFEDSKKRTISDTRPTTGGTTKHQIPNRAYNRAEMPQPMAKMTMLVDIWINRVVGRSAPCLG